MTATGATSNCRQENISDHRKWQMVRARDKSLGAVFFYAVKTTGIYCRPGCPARTPARKNVEFFEKVSGAEAAGYRPCKRCRPHDTSPIDPRALIVANACQAMESTLSDQSRIVPLRELAALAAMSPFHFHRLFRAVTGVTPGAYSKALRAKKLRRTLRSGSIRNVTEAFLDSGYGSTASFYQEAQAALAMKPETYRRGGVGEKISYAIADCWLGKFAVAMTARGVCAVILADAPHQLEDELRIRFPDATLIDGGTNMQATIDNVVAAIERPDASFELPLDVKATLFEQEVWQALRAIPPGETRTYTEIAEAVGRPTAVRAVAKACAANPIAVLTPCHRVLRKDGSLAGYRWGTRRKDALLKREKDG